MADAQGRGWGAPCKVPVVTLVRSDGLRIPVHRDIASLVLMLMELTELAGYDIKPGQTWGFSCRKISGTDVWSNHSWGLAIDVNAPSNPYASVTWHVRNFTAIVFGLKRVTNIPQKVFELWEAYGFRVGVKYDSKPDPMHFEYMGTPAQAQHHTAQLRKWIDDNKKPTPAPKPTIKDDDMRVVQVLDGPDKDKVFFVMGNKYRLIDRRSADSFIRAGLLYSMMDGIAWSQVLILGELDNTL